MKAILLGLIVLAAPGTAQDVSKPRAALPGALPITLAEKPGPVSHSAPINGVLTLFGNERCPTDNDGNEIVVCVRRGAQEQYRVPKELRDFKVTPENAAWATKVRGVMDEGAGVASIDTCSTVGIGGQTGCFARDARQTRAVNADRRAEEARAP